MNNNSISRGCFALAILLGALACSSGQAQTTYYNWQGGSGTAAGGTWLASGGTSWSTGTGANFLSPVTQNQPWVQDGTGGSTSIATIGYLTTSGSGSIREFSVYDFAPSFFTQIALSSGTAIQANSLIFANQIAPPLNNTGALDQYALTGGTLNLTNNGVANGVSSTFNITVDLVANPPAIADYAISNSISSSLTVGGGTGTLAYGVAISNTTSNASDNSSSILDLSGSNSFAAAIVGGIGPATNRNFSAMIFTTTQSLNYKGQVPNITLGNLGEVVYMGPNSSIANPTAGTIGTVTLDPTIGLNSSPLGAGVPVQDQVIGNFQRNTGLFGYGMNGKGEIARIGVGTSNAAAAGHQYPTLYVGAITGSGDVEFASSYASDGDGVLVLTQTSSYTGDTFMTQASTRAASTTVPVPMVRLGINNALPTTTNLIFGDISAYATGYNSGAFDLNGHYQQVGSIDTSDGTSTNQFYAGINNYSLTTGTLAIYNAPASLGNPMGTIEAPFKAIIGKQILDGTTGLQTSDSNPNNSNKIALVLMASNNGTLTLGLGYYQPAGSTVQFSQANTYNGGTTISGGALFAANGTIYWDGISQGVWNNGAGGPAGSSSASVPNSATGTGPVVVNAGGTFGGSKVGGAVGMPDSVAFAQGAVGPTGGSVNAGAVIVNGGGYLLPGGGYYDDTSGNGGTSAGGGSFVTGGSGGVAVAIDPLFNPTVGPTFHVLGNLILNNSANVNFNFNSSGFDTVTVGGSLNLAGGTGTVNIGINDIGGATIYSGDVLFSAASLKGSTANLASSTLPAGDSFAVYGNEILLVTPGSLANLAWVGSVVNSGSYVWDTTTGTANFAVAGVQKAFIPNDNVTFDDSGLQQVVSIASSGVAPNSVVFNNQAKTYTLQGGAITGGASVNLQGGGTVIFSNSNTYSGTTTIQQGSTLEMTSPAALPASGVVNISGFSTLELAYTDNGTGTYNGTINIGQGAGQPAINVPAGSVTLSGVVSGGTGAIGLTKTGSGTLVLTNTGGGTSLGTNDLDGGLVEFGAVLKGDGFAYYPPMGSGNLNIAYAGSASGGGLWLNNVQMGYNQNQTKTDTLGWFRLYPGAVLKGTGSGAAVANTNIEAILNWNGSVYSPASVLLTTGTSASDTLSLQNAIEQFDPNYFDANEYVNYIVGNGTANANYLLTAQVGGAGTVRLQSGDNTTANAFGGAWSVNSGVLQVGPFVSTTSALPGTTSAGTAAGAWSGAAGEVLTSLGFKVAYASTTNFNGAGNPDLPNAVTVNSGGMFAIANDQIDGNGISLSTGFNNPYQNGVPAFYRNLVTLNGGTLAATGAEVTWNYTSSSNSASQGVMSAANSGVVARLGGGFSGTSGTTSTILTYDPNGYSAANGVARTVELVGGTRVLYNASPGLPIGPSVATWSDSSIGFASVTTTTGSVTIQYETNWAGNLVIASSGNIGGTFNIERSGGSVSVQPGAVITVQPYATVNISNDNQSTLVMSSSLNANYGFLTAGTAGTLPVLNNVLSAGGNSVAIANSGTFNVNAGSQSVGAITGNGAFNVTSTATASAPTISQSSATVASGATLNLTGPGASSAASMTLSNSGNLNVSGGSHTFGAVYAADVSLNAQGTTTVSGGTLVTPSLYQNALNVSGGRITLTATGGPSGVTNLVNTFNQTGGLVDVQDTGFFFQSGAGSAAIFSAIQQGSGGIKSGPGSPTSTWSGTGGITSTTRAAGNPNTYGVGFVPNWEGSGYTLIAAAFLGDAGLTGQVNGGDVGMFFGPGNVLGNVGTGWPGGDFYYQGIVTTADRSAALRNAGQSGPAAATPDLASADSGTASVVYNKISGVLSLVLSGTPNLDSLDVYVLSASNNVNAQVNVNASTWEIVPNTAATIDTYEWSEINLGTGLADGTYVLANLPGGLTGSSFGVNGVQYSDFNGNTVYDSVSIVPEPGTLAVLTAAALLAGGGCAVRRRAGRQRRRRVAAFNEME